MLHVMYLFPDLSFQFVKSYSWVLFPGILHISVNLVICFSCWVFCSLMCIFSVTPPPCSIQSMCVSFVFFYVKCYSDFPASTLICVLADSVSGSPLKLTCRVSDPCLCFTLISACSFNKSLVSQPLPCASGSFPTHPFTVRKMYCFYVVVSPCFQVGCHLVFQSRFSLLSLLNFWLSSLMHLLVDCFHLNWILFAHHLTIRFYSFPCTFSLGFDYCSLFY